MDLLALEPFAAEHHGLVTHDESLRVGISSAPWYRAHRNRLLEPLHRSVARMVGTARSPEQAIAAAVLAAGRGALASHRSAAFLWGIPRPKTDPIDITLPDRSRRASLSAVVIHRPRDLDDLTSVRREGIQTTNVLRTLCDLGAVDGRSVHDAVGHVVTSGLASPAALRNAVDLWVGGRLLDHRQSGGLECDGWTWHGRQRSVFERDKIRDADLAAAGYIVVRFTFRQIMKDPAKQADRIRRVVHRSSPALLGATQISP